MQKSIVAFLAFVACGQPAPPTDEWSWLHGFKPAAISEEPSPVVSQRLRTWQSCEEPCADYGGLEVLADVAPAAGTEMVLASFASGVVVLDHRGRLIARGDAYEPTGSADELVALAVGAEPPVIAIVVRSGGRREHSTTVELYRVGSGRTLERLFAGVVETYVDGRSITGTITLTSQGVLYRPPGAETAVVHPFRR